MKVIISRTYTPNETLGALFVMEGSKKLFEGVSIELPDKGNQHNISCILEGIYDVVKYDSPKKGKVFLLLNVPGRSAVEIHIGNYAAGKKVDTQGCILPGLRFDDINHDGNLDVAYSTQALGTLLDLLPDKFKLYII
jgi:hypothetical protein